MARIRAFAGLLLTLSLLPGNGAAGANERMAGSSGGTAVKAASAHETVLPLTKEERNRIESYGLIDTPVKGGLGIDLWAGSERGLILQLLGKMPGQAAFPALQDVYRRLLLTAADPAFLGESHGRTSSIQADDDLFTLRIEKLMEAGNFSSAAALYSMNTIDPYSERLARDGILAILYSGHPALACLENRAFKERFKGSAFWEQLSTVCTYIIMSPEVKKSGSDSPAPKIPESEILNALVHDRNYRFKPDTIDDVVSLSPLELAVIFGGRYIDYGRLPETPDLEGAPAWAVALLLGAPDLPPSLYFSLLNRAVALGIKDPDSLKDYFDKQTFKDNQLQTTEYKSVMARLADWQKIPYLYRMAVNAAKGKEQDAIIAAALALDTPFGLAPLLPFAGLLADSEPENYPPEAIRTVFRILAYSDRDISASWLKKFFDNLDKISEPDRSAFLTYLAISDNENAKNELLKHAEFKEIYDNSGDQRKNFLKESLIKLDKKVKLHNYVAAKYEKDSSLTSVDDYVMQSVDLTDQFTSAQQEQRMGETVLLSLAVLHDLHKSEYNAEALSEVLFGLETVGLIKEAQSLTADVLLGFQK